jgi:hypothetical protein
MTDPASGDGYIAPMYAPDNAPQHRYETERFTSILRDYVNKHGRTKGLTEFIASIQGVSRPLLCGVVGVLLIDLLDHEGPAGSERRLLSVDPDMWNDVTEALKGGGFRVDPTPGTERFQSPVYSTYSWATVLPEQDGGAQPTQAP